MGTRQYLWEGKEGKGIRKLWRWAHSIRGPSCDQGTLGLKGGTQGSSCDAPSERGGTQGPESMFTAQGHLFLKLVADLELELGLSASLFLCLSPSLGER